jgi:DNA mismatch repair protein MutL
VPELQLQPAVIAPALPMTIPLPGAYSGVFPSRWSVGGSASREPWETRMGDAPAGSPSADTALADGAAPAEAGGQPIFRSMMPLGQFRDTFIIAVDEDGLAIIDQHVAHERVLFERITERLTKGRLESQGLLVPVILELSADAKTVLASHAADLDRLGFELEEFGGNSLRISAIPALLGRDECEATIRAMSDDLEGFDRGARVDDAIKRIAATMACHAAVKANYPLTHDKMVHILEELRRTAYSSICPHGRPVMLRLTRREVEKNFQRI